MNGNAIYKININDFDLTTFVDVQMRCHIKWRQQKTALQIEI